MYKLIPTIIALCTATIGFCQTQETKYFNNKYLQKETTQQKGKYSQTIIKNPDGSLTTEVTDIRKDEIISSETFKGDEPSGIWKYKHRNIREPLDYSFDLIYSDQPCIDTIAGLHSVFEDNDSLKYISPKIHTGEPTVSHFLAKHIYYPSSAVENGLQGKVYLTYTITSKGEIENVVVKKGANIVLDKEAVRVMRKLKLTNAPTINGQPKAICVTMPITFKLE
jgi:TonB family protein